jgi:hypothetical protein
MCTQESHQQESLARAMSMGGNGKAQQKYNSKPTKGPSSFPNRDISHFAKAKSPGLMQLVAQPLQPNFTETYV